MTIQSFKPSVWETALLTEFRGISVANLITTPPSKVEGQKAIFNKISGGTIKDYSGTVTYDTATTTPVELIYDKKKYFAMELDDVDAVQAAADVLQTSVKEKALDMREVVDGDVFAKAVAKCPAANKIGSSSAKIDLNSKSAYDLVVDLGVKLSKKKAPKAGRFVLASSEVIQQMAKDDRFARNYTVLENGIISGATINGMTIIETEDLPANTILCLHKSALGKGEQLSKVEALRLQGAFADAVRGLLVYGIEALREDAIAMAYYEFKTAAV